MPAMKLSVARAPRGRSAIDIPIAALVWLATWLTGNLLAGVILGAAGRSGGGPQPVWVSVVGAVALLLPMIGGLVYLSRRLGVGSFAADYGFSWQPADLVGLPVGVLSQLVLLRLAYWPLGQWWPHTFGRDKVEQSARDLSDAAHGGWYVLLVLIVVVGAPIVEELFFRGFLFRILRVRAGFWLAAVLDGLIFGAVHGSLIILPVLAVLGVALCWVYERTGSLFPCIAIHALNNTIAYGATTENGWAANAISWLGLDQVLAAVGLIPAPGQLMNTPFSLVLGMTYTYLPFMILPLYSNLSKMDLRLLEAASDLGATAWVAFWKVTVPLSKAGIVAGSMLVFIPCVGEYVIPELLGGPQTQMIGRTLWDEFFGNNDWPMASAVAVVMVLLVIVPLALFNRYQAQAAERLS